MHKKILLFDAGDTITHAEQRSFIEVSPIIMIVTTAPSETTHNFQGSVGLGFRF